DGQKQHGCCDGKVRPADLEVADPEIFPPFLDLLVPRGYGFRKIFSFTIIFYPLDQLTVSLYLLRKLPVGSLAGKEVFEFSIPECTPVISLNKVNIAFFFCHCSGSIPTQTRLSLAILYLSTSSFSFFRQRCFFFFATASFLKFIVLAIDSMAKLLYKERTSTFRQISSIWFNMRSMISFR